MANRFDKLYSLIPFLVILGGGFLLFAGTFGHQWTFDDFPVLVDNPDIRSLGNFFRDSYPGRPLREITYLLDHALFGLRPAGYHVQNIFWHGLNAWLVFLLVLRLGGSRFTAWCAALLFLSHPLVVEVVANVSHRKDSLALAFSLLALLAYGKAVERENKRAGWLLASLLLWGTALLAKQNALVLPLACCAYEAARVPHGRRLILGHPRLLLWGGGLLLALASVFVWLSADGEGYLHILEGHLARQNYFGDDRLWAHAALTLKSWAFMALKILVPVGLAVEYTLAVPETPFDPWILSALGLAAAVIGAIVFTRDRHPLAFFGLAWFGIFWLPTSNIWPLAYYAADRYLYAPLVGVAIAFAWWLDHLPAREVARLVVLAILVGVLGGLTWKQVQVWHSPLTLWSNAYRGNPTSSFVLNNMGNLAWQAGDEEEAARYYSRAVAVNPRNPTAHFNLGLIHERHGRREKALKHFVEFIKINDPMFAAESVRLRQRLRLQYGLKLD